MKVNLNDWIEGIRIPAVSHSEQIKVRIVDQNEDTKAKIVQY